MSRIGKLPVTIPAGVNINVSDENVVTVKGPLGELAQKVNPKISVSIENGTVELKRASEEKSEKAMHGLYRSLINNMVVGVSKGYEIKLEFVGVGYRAEVIQHNVLDLVLG